MHDEFSIGLILEYTSYEHSGKQTTNAYFVESGYFLVLALRNLFWN